MSEVLSRVEFVKRAITPEMFGLEVGPSYSPMLSKAEYNVETLDHASAEELRRKYAPMVGDVSRIEEVDYISDGRPMEEFIPRRGEYDYILASHVIEHVIDPLGFLKSCEALLKPSGKLVLMIPDKRNCFDALQPITSTGEIVDTHYDKRSRHRPGMVFDYIANTVGMEGQGIWEQGWRGKLRMANKMDDTVSAFHNASQSADYIDIHAWRFTPSSFRLIVSDLGRLGLTQLKEVELHVNNSFEFFFTAGMQGAGYEADRTSMLRDVLAEQYAGLSQLTDCGFEGL